MDISSIRFAALGRILLLFVLTTGTIFFTFTRLTSSTSPLQSERTFENTVPKDVPIKIKIKKEKDEAFRDLANEKWLSEFELEVTNTGNKPIYFLYITMITDVRVDGQRIVFPLTYGRPELGDIVTRPGPDDPSIKPGETYVLKMGEAPVWEKGVRDKRWPQATKFRAELQSISFGDGTGYFGNHPYTPAVKPQQVFNDQVHGARSAKTRARPPGPPVEDVEVRSQLSWAQKPANFLPAKFLSVDKSNVLAPEPVEPFSCMFPECVAVIPWSGWVCWDNQDRPQCKFQNRPTPDVTGVCKELVFDRILCVAGSVEYFCQTITIYDCGLGPAPTPTPSPTPSPEPVNTALIQTHFTQQTAVILCIQNVILSHLNTS